MDSLSYFIKYCKCGNSYILEVYVSPDGKEYPGKTRTSDKKKEINYCPNCYRYLREN